MFATVRFSRQLGDFIVAALSVSGAVKKGFVSDTGC